MLANTRWNIFARTLEDILTKRHLNWQDLYRQAGIEQESVESLQASLLSPTAFPILTVEEMDDVIDAFDMSSQEMLQLRAAIIATSVERMLIERIESQAALLAAEQVFATTLDALAKQKDEKHGDTRPMSDEGPERFFAEVRRYIDAGKEARQLSRSVSGEIRAEWLRRALYYFEQARNVLEREKKSPLASLKLWKHSYQQVQKESDQIKKELKALRQ